MIVTNSSIYKTNIDISIYYFLLLMFDPVLVHNTFKNIYTEELRGNSPEHYFYLPMKKNKRYMGHIAHQRNSSNHNYEKQ